MDMPESEPEAQLLMRHPHEHGGLSSSATLEEEGDHGLGEALADKLDDAFPEDPEALDGVASSSEGEPGPPCFCSAPLEIVEDDSEEDGYEEFRRRLGMELAEPVPHHERKNVMRTIVRVAVYAVLHHCLREKLFENGEGCVIDAPAQWHHDCVTWTSMDRNCKLWDLCAELCLESLLNTIIAIGYVMQRLCLTQEHLAQGVTLRNAVQFSGDPDRVLKKMSKLEDACLQRYIDRLVHTKSDRTLLKKKSICKKSKRIN
nr:uncharacterized protein LOC125629688 isoform X2 [Caretta caretta]